MTPVTSHGGILVKREDMLTADLPGVIGGKYRLAAAMDAGRGGLIGYGGRTSNSAAALAAAGRAAGVPVRFHTAAGPDTPEMARTAELGAEIIRHRPGYSGVVRARAREDAAARGWACGFDCSAVITAVARQVRSLQQVDFTRVVMAVGAGITLAGVAAGLARYDMPEPILAVTVGAAPDLRMIDRLSPQWRARTQIIPAGVPYETAVTADLDGLPLHPIYEAKLIPHLQPGDVLWLVGT